MYRKPSYWAVLLFSALVACAAYGQDATTKADQALIDKIAQEYEGNAILNADPNINFSLLKLATQLDVTRKKLLTQTPPPTDDAYWDEVSKEVTATIGKLNSPPPVKTEIEKFFTKQIAFFKGRGQANKNNNDELVLLWAAVHKANKLDIQWQDSVRGTTPSGRTSTATPSAAAAAQGVPQWYKSLTEHKKEIREYRAKKRAWHRAVHGY